MVVVPDCSKDLRPVVGQKFKSLDFCFAFYDVYARAVGFDTRKAQLRKADVVITWYNVVCNRKAARSRARMTKQMHGLVFRLNVDVYQSVVVVKPVSHSSSSPTKEFQVILSRSLTKFITIIWLGQSISSLCQSIESWTTYIINLSLIVQRLT